jgi:hypothetical protein
VQTPLPLHGFFDPPGHSTLHASPLNPGKQTQLPSSWQSPFKLHGFSLPPLHSSAQLTPVKPGKHLHAPSTHSPRFEQGVESEAMDGHDVLQLTPL